MYMSRLSSSLRKNECTHTTHAHTHTENMSHLDWVENTKRVGVCFVVTHTHTNTYTHTHTDTDTHTHTHPYTYCKPDLSPLGRTKDRRKSESDCLTHGHTRTHPHIHTPTHTHTFAHARPKSPWQSQRQKKGWDFLLEHLTHVHTHTYTHTHTFACTRPVSPWQSHKQNKEWTLFFVGTHSVCVYVSLSLTHTQIFAPAIPGSPWQCQRQKKEWASLLRLLCADESLK